MKKMLLSLCIALSIPMHAQTITNGNFEDWSGSQLWISGSKVSDPLLQNTPISNYAKYDISRTSNQAPYIFTTAWEANAGSGTKGTEVAHFQAPGRSGYGLALSGSRNSSTDTRIYCRDAISLTAGKTYQLKFWIKGNVSLLNVILTSKSLTNTSNGITSLAWTNGESVATASTASNIMPTNKSDVLKTYTETDWKEIVCNYTISSTGDYRIVICYCSTPQVNATNLNAGTVFHLDDISLAEYQDNSICTLTSFRLKNYSVDSFDPSKTDYSVTIANASNIPEVTATPTDPASNIHIIQAMNLNGTVDERTAKVVVTAADGVTTKTYSLIINMTDDVLMEGNASTAELPANWNSNLWDKLTTWYCDNSASHNNAQYWGTSSLRPRGTDGSNITSGSLTTMLLPNAGKLSFYIKKGASAVAPSTLSIDWKNENNADEPANWRSIATLSLDDIATTYEKKEYDVNSLQSGAIRFSFTKPDNNTPFYLDDFKVTQYSTPSSVWNTLTAFSAVYVENNRLIISLEQPEAYRITALDGKLVAQGVAANTVVELPNGVYFVAIAGQVYKVATK